MLGLLLGATMALASEIGAEAPDFSLTSITGQTVKLSDYRGKTVILEWFNPGCPFVKYAHGEGVIREQAAKWVSDDTVWLAINSGAPGKQGADPEENRAAVEKWQINYPVLMDPTGEVGQSYAAKTTPQMAVVNPEGVLVFNGALDNAPMGKKKGDPMSHLSNSLEALKSGQPVPNASPKPYGCSVKYAK